MEDETIQQFQMMTPTNLPFSDGARCVKVGRGIHKHEKSDLPEAFHERSTGEFGEEYGAPPFPRKKLNLGLAEMQISAVLRALLELSSLFLMLPQPPYPTLTLRQLEIWRV